MSASNAKTCESSVLKVDFFRHNIDERDIARVCDVLRSKWLSTGPVTAEFEAALAKYVRSKYALGVMSCTAAIHLALEAIGIKAGDEVLTTPMTFVATAHAVLHCGATPRFVDVEDSGNINVDLVRKAISKKTKAILPVHLYGQMCDMKALRKVAKGIPIIEDAAHALESERDGVRVGQLGEAACFSFYPTKSITCGEGGALTTSNRKLFEVVRLLRLHGMDKSAADRYTKRYQHWDVVVDGWKYNMADPQAALLLGQLERAEEIRKKRERAALRYREAFEKAGIEMPALVPNAKHAWHLFTIHVPPKRRDEILHGLQDRGVGVAVNFRAIHLLTFFRKRFGFRAGDFPNAERIGASTISLPLYARLTDEEIEYVIQNVIALVRP